MNHEAFRIRDINDTAASLAANSARGDTLAAAGDRAALVERLRAAFGRATIAFQDARRSLYRAEVSGARHVGLARANEARAFAKLSAAEKAFRAATTASK